MDFSSKIGQALQSREYLARHPGSSTVQSDIYATNLNSVSELAQRQRFSGQYVTQATNSQFGSQTTFFLSPGSVLGQLVVTGTVTLPQFSRGNDFWMLNAIASIELVLSGTSSVQSLKIDGRSHMDQIMATLDSNKLQLLRKSNGAFFKSDAGSIVVTGSIPLHLFFSSAEMAAILPLDSSTLNSQILINIRWKPVYEVFSGDSVNAVVLPNAMTDLYLRVSQQVNISNDFALSNMLKNDPELVYSIPSLYLQSYSQVVNITSVALGAAESMVNLTSMPSGHLQYILFSVRPVAQEGIVATTGLINPFAQIASVRVMYNGVELYRQNYKNELMLANSLMTDCDNGINLSWNGFRNNILAQAPVLFNATPCIIIPFANQISEVLRNRRQEHTKDYSGSSIQIFFTIFSGLDYVDDTNPIWQPTPLAQVTGDYRCQFTFANAGLYEISSRSVALEM